MTERVEDYLEARRSLGYKLQIEGEVLHRFAHFASKRAHTGPITTDLALAWANDSKRDSDLYRARRLEIVRCLARYCTIFEPDTDIPAQRLLGPAHRRKTPYIFSDQEIADLLEAAGGLMPKGGLRPLTLQFLFGLLAATGLRISEALNFTRADVDLGHGILVVRETKFNKSRYVPVDDTTVEELRTYDQFRIHHIPLPQSQSFFLVDNGEALNYRQVLHAFQRIRKQLVWKSRNGRRPRIHDLRHTFATRRLLSWYQEGVDVNQVLPALSTYLGHCKVTDTYWYLTGIPELMKIATNRFEHFVLAKESHHD